MVTSLNANADGVDCPHLAIRWLHVAPLCTKKHAMNDPFTLAQEVGHLRAELSRQRRAYDELLDEHEERIRQLERTIMSQALWCDPGNHAFSSLDENRRRMTSEDAHGDSITVDICSEHLPSYFQPNKPQLETQAD